MKKGIFLLMFAVLGVWHLNGQVTLAFQGFELGDSWTISSGASISAVTGTSDTPSNQRIKSGSNSHQTINGTETLILSGFANTTHSSRYVDVWMSSTSGTIGNGADGADNVKFYAASTASFSATADVTINGNSNVRFGMNGTGDVTTTAGTATVFTYSSGGTKTGTDAKSKIRINIPDAWANIHLKVETENNNSDERWNIDDIELFGTLSTPTVGFALASSSVTEGDAGTSNHSIDVTMNLAPIGTVIVGLTTTPGTATAITDYTVLPVPPALTFLTTDTYPYTQSVDVIVVGDTNVEPDEDFTVNLAITSGTADVGTTEHTVTITNDDVLPVVGFTTASSSVTEEDAGTSTHTVMVSMDIAPSSDADVDVVSVENTATEGSDYVAVSPTLTFPAIGLYPMTQNVSITINGDTDVESDETFDLILAMATGDEGLADEGTDAHEVTITNDDIPPVCLEEDFVDFSDWTNGGTGTDTSPSHYGDASPCRSLSSGGGSGSSIISPSFNFPSILAFFQDASGPGNGQTATVEYKIGAGSWTSLYSFSVSTLGGTESVDLTNVSGVDLSTESAVSFRFNSTFNTWYLDDVVVSGASCVLPIQLLSFTAKAKNNQTLLNWKTATELNNDYMAVEHSTDGRNFKEIGRVQGAGTSADVQEYQFTDTKPAEGLNYYRLRQVDYDGHTEYHKVVSVMIYGQDGDIRLVPTEVQDEVMLYLPETINSAADIRIYDVSGRLWKTSKVEAGNSQMSLNLSQLAAGHYILHLVNEERVSTVRFNKL